MTRSRANRSRLAAGVVALAALALTTLPGVTAASASDPRVGAVPPAAGLRPAFLTTPAGAIGSSSSIRSWQVESSAVDQDSGTAISEPGYDASQWYVGPARSTVMATLLADHVFGATNLFYSDNLSSVDPAMFQVPWWYRTTFEVSKAPGRTVLRADGIIPGADVWVDGVKVASASRVAGAYTVNDIDVSDIVHSGTNAVALSIPPADPEKDFSIGWVDWNQTPPDNNMGIWRDVDVLRTGDVSVLSPEVTATLGASNTSADLTISVTATNHAASSRQVSVTAKVSGHGAPITVSRSVSIAADATRTVHFDATTNPALHLDDPAIWWPVGEGLHPLYRVTTWAVVGGTLSDKAGSEFGIRTVSSTVEPGGGRQFSVNGVPLQIRGGGWAPDLFLRYQPERTATELGYVADMGLNAVRLEGKLENPTFFDQADRAGILVLPGWECCDKWEAWAGTGGQPWSAHDRTIAARSAGSEAVLLRDHPSVIAFLIGSDNAPPDGIAQRYVHALRSAGWSTPIVASAASAGDGPAGPSGMKMNGPYAWVPPNYWFDRAGYLGGAIGFDSETSAGEDIPPLDDLRRFMSPADQHALWSEPDVPQFHSGRTGTRFAKLTIYDHALAERYGSPTSIGDFVRTSQLTEYEAVRAQFEAFGAEASASRPATGVIYWMLDNAWPSLHWSLFDWYLHPSAAFYAAQEANQPLHIQYDEAGHVQIVNHRTTAATGPFIAQARIRDIVGSVPWRRVVTVDDVPALGTRTILTLPKSAPSQTYFLELTLRRQDGSLVSRNVYWLSARPDRLDPNPNHTTWYYTPTVRFADLRDLQSIGAAELGVTERTVTLGDRTRVYVTVQNTGGTPALGITAALHAGTGGPEALPVRWNTNDITLFQSETAHLVATVPTDALHGSQPSLTFTAFN